MIASVRIGLLLMVAVLLINRVHADSTPPVVADLRWSDVAVGTLTGLVYDEESGVAQVTLIGPRDQRCAATMLYAGHIRVVCPATLTNPSQWRLEVLDHAGNLTRHPVP